MMPIEPSGRATDYAEPAPSEPLPRVPRIRVPLLRVLVGVTALAGLISLHPVLREEIKFATVAALLLSALALIAGAAWKNRERGFATGFVLSGVLAAQIWFYLAAVSWNSVNQYAAPIFGITLLLMLPVLLGYLGGRYTEEKGTQAEAELRRAEPLWSVAVLVLCSLSLVFAVGMGGSRPPKPNRAPARPLPPVPLVAAPQTTLPVAWGTITASFEDLKTIRPTVKKASPGAMHFWSSGYGLLLASEGDALVTSFPAEESAGVMRNHGYVWTEKGGYLDLNATYPELRHLEQVMAASHDGSVLHVRYSSPAMSGESIWRKKGGLQTNFADEAAAWVLAHPDATPARGGGSWLGIHAISGDGKTILLSSGQSVLRWTERGGFGRIVGVKPNPTVRAVTRNGDAFAGYNSVNAFVWSERGGMQEIPRLAGTGGAVAYGVSPGGAFVTGTSGNYLFRWTKQGGTENLGRLPGDSMITSGNAVHIEQRGHSVSDDGKIIVGTAGNIPFIWSKQSGVIPLREVLANCGASVAGSSVEAAAVSADGRQITGVTREGDGLHRWRLLIR